MPRDSNGNASLDPVYVATPGTTIRAVQHNTPIADIIQMLTGSLARGGQGGMLANLAMGGFKITGLADGENAQDAVTFGQTQGKYLNYDTPQTLTDNQKKSVVSAIGAIPQYATGAALPTSNIGPIWHDDYAAIMTWDGVGYASLNVGQSAYFTMSTAPNGWIPENGAEVSRAAYAALFRKIGTTFGAGNGTTTFNLPDSRGLFKRAQDSGRGVDANRAIGSFQDDAIRNITGVFGNDNMTRDNNETATGAFYLYGRWGSASGPGGYSGSAFFGFDASRVVPTAAENRPKNISYPSFIKF